MKLHLLPIFTTLTLVGAQDGPVHQATNQNETVEPNYDYVVKMGYKIEENKLPSYLINLIYQNTEKNFVSTKDAILLFKINTATIDTTSTILDTIGTPLESLFSVAGVDATLKTLSWNFTGFYNTLTTNLALSGKPLRDALEALDIDSARFSAGIAYGEPDPFEEFKKGTFSKETLDNACKLTSITLEQLFGGVRDVVLNFIAKTLDQKNFVELAISQGVTRDKAVELWNVLNISTEDVYNVEFFRNKLNAIRQQLESNLTLGVVTPTANITINRKTYDIWKNDFELISVYGENPKVNYSVMNIEEYIYENLVVLGSVGLTPYTSYVEIGSISEHFKNCMYVTFKNDEIVVEPVQNVTKGTFTIEVTLANTANLVLGSPLICENKVYGLAKDISDDLKTITLDVFKESIHSGTTKQSNTFWNLVLLFISVWYVSLP